MTTKKRQNKKRIKARRRRVAVFFGEISAVCLLVLACFTCVDFVKNNTRIPSMKIYLNGVTLDAIHENGKHTEYFGNDVILDVEGGAKLYRNVAIKGRGNYTWNDVKKPYRLKFGSAVELLGLGRGRKWVLLTNNMDDALMRNDLAFFLAGMINEEYPLNGKFVELSVDDEDLGVYTLTRSVEIAKDVVDLRNPRGVLVELDNIYCHVVEGHYWTDGRNCLVLNDAVDGDEGGMAFYEFVSDFEEFETALFDGDFDAVNELIDVKSFAEYFVMSEVSANPDAYVTSWYFYRDGDEDKIHAGPAWDYDSAFGNKRWGGGAMWEGFYAPNTSMARRNTAYGEGVLVDGENIDVEEDVSVSKIMYKLMEMPEFVEEVERVYRERVEGRENELIDYIDRQAAMIRKDALLDTEKWEKDDFDTAVDYLKWWVGTRIEFLDGIYGTEREAFDRDDGVNVEENMNNVNELLPGED